MVLLKYASFNTRITLPHKKLLLITLSWSSEKASTWSDLQLYGKLMSWTVELYQLSIFWMMLPQLWALFRKSNTRTVTEINSPIHQNFTAGVAGSPFSEGLFRRWITRRQMIDALLRVNCGSFIDTNTSQKYHPGASNFYHVIIKTHHPDRKCVGSLSARSNPRWIHSPSQF